MIPQAASFWLHVRAHHGLFWSFIRWHWSMLLHQPSRASLHSIPSKDNLPLSLTVPNLPGIPQTGLKTWDPVKAVTSSTVTASSQTTLWCIKRTTPPAVSCSWLIGLFCSCNAKLQRQEKNFRNTCPLNLQSKINKPQISAGSKSARLYLHWQ